MFQLIVVPTKKVKICQQHQPGDDRRPLEMHRDSNDKDVKNQWEIYQCADGGGPRNHEQQGGEQLTNPQKPPIKAGAIEGLKEKADRIVQAQHGESIAQQFGYTRREKSKRQNDSDENGEDSKQSATSHSGV